MVLVVNKYKLAADKYRLVVDGYYLVIDGYKKKISCLTTTYLKINLNNLIP